MCGGGRWGDGRGGVGGAQSGAVGTGLLQGARMYFGGSVVLELCFPFAYVYNILFRGLRLTSKLEVSVEAGLSSLSQGHTLGGELS